MQMMLLSVLVSVAVLASNVGSTRRILKTHTENRNKESQYKLVSFCCSKATLLLGFIC